MAEPLIIGYTDDETANKALAAPSAAGRHTPHDEPLRGRRREIQHALDAKAATE